MLVARHRRIGGRLVLTFRRIEIQVFEEECDGQGQCLDTSEAGPGVRRGRGRPPYFS
jgi:hypothetical protein